MSFFYLEGNKIKNKLEDEVLEFLEQFNLPDFELVYSNIPNPHHSAKLIINYEVENKYKIIIGRLFMGDFDEVKIGNETSTEKNMRDFFKENNLKMDNNNLLIFILFHEVGHIIDIERIGDTKKEGFDYEESADTHAKRLFNQYIREGYKCQKYSYQKASQI